MTSLSEKLVSKVMAKPITEGDRHVAAAFVMDTLASAIAGQNTDQGRILLDWARLQRNDNASSLSAQSAAFLLGALTHILEIDDLHRASVTHPGCVVVSAAWSVARREDANPDAFLDAVLRGYEAMCRVGMAVGDAHYKYWHNTATCGPFGSAVAAGSILRLSEVEMVHAFGNAGTQSAGLWEFLETGAMSKHLHAGRGAEAGVLAADLAKRGFTGPPAILEGNRGFFKAACPDVDPEQVLLNFDGPWQLSVTSIKPWPSCRHTHATIDAAQSVKERLGDSEIDQIRVRTYQAALDLCDRAVPTSIYEAKFSLQHTAVAGLAKASVGFDAFDAESRDACAQLRRRVRLELDPAYDNAYPAAFGSGLDVILKDGRVLSEERLTAKGDPEAAIPAEELAAKARMLLSFSNAANANLTNLGLTPEEIGSKLPAIEPAIPVL